MPRTRASRALIGLLGVTLVLGLIFYFHNASRSNAKPADAPQASVVPSAAATQQPAGTQPPQHQPAVTVTPVVSSTPTTPTAPTAPNPSTQPAAQATSHGAPTTAPVATAAPVAWNSDPAPQPAVSATPVSDAQAKMAAGQLLEARTILNEALLSGRLSEADTVAVKKLMAEINQTVIFSPRKFPDDPFAGSHQVKSGERLSKIADACDTTWEFLARINATEPRKLQAGKSIKIIRGPFNAVVNKRTFTMDIYLGPPGERGSLYVTSFPVGLGENDSTPTGAWLVEPAKKIKNPTYYSPRGEGVIDADDPKNPLGERWIGLTGISGEAVGKESYGIHGTIEPETIGKMASMGCIRLRNEDVERVYEMMIEGKSTVVVTE